MPIYRLAWLTLFVVGAGLELAALLNRHPGDTFSETVWHYAERYPVLVLIAGIIVGHLFWSTRHHSP